MLEELLSLFGARNGHFRYESGHHGDLWLEIPRIYTRPSSLRKFAAGLARRLAPHGVEAVCGPLVEGALLAQMVAEELDVEFYFAEPALITSSTTAVALPKAGPRNASGSR